MALSGYHTHQDVIPNKIYISILQYFIFKYLSQIVFCI